MSLSEKNKRLEFSAAKKLWLLVVLGCLHCTNQSIAQDCDSPCDGIDALGSFQIWLDSEGVCAPFVATLMSDVPSPLCGDFSYQWNVQGGQYEWSVGSLDSDASPSIVFLEPVFYEVELTVSAANSPACAIASSMAYVGAAEAPQVSVTQGGEICAFDTWETLVYVNPGNTAISSFAWIVNGDSIMSTAPAPLTMPFEEAGTAEIVAIVENTCGTASDTSFVEVRALPPVAVDYDYGWICQGAPVEVNASGADHYVWSSSATILSGGAEGDSVAVYSMNNTIVGSVEGTTSYESLSCTASAGFQINSFFVPSISIVGDETICDGDLVAFESAVQSFGWSSSQAWSFDDSLVAGNYLDLSNLDLIAGDYAVNAEVVFDPFPVWLQPTGCTGSAELDFEIVNLPEVTAPQDLVFCNQDYNEFLPEGSPAGGSWEGPGILDGFFNPEGFDLGTVGVEYQFTDSNGCSSVDTSHVMINEPILASAGLDSSVCESSEWVNLTGFDEMESGVWSGPALMDPYSGLVDVGELPVGMNEFVYQIGEGSCVSADSVVWTVMEHPLVLLSTQGSLACDADTVWFEVFAGGGTLGEGNDYSLTWSDGVQFTAANDPFWIADIDEGFSFVFVEISDDEGCSDASSAFIEPIALPEIVLPDFWQLCNQSLEVTVPPFDPPLGMWSGEGVVHPDGIFNPALVGEGIHQLIYTATGPVGCSNSDSMQVEISTLDTISAGLDQVICEGTPELLLIDYLPVTGGWWSGEGVVDSSHIVATEELPVGFHEYIYHTGSSTCAQRDTVMIEVRSLPNATIETGTSEFCPEDSIALSAFPFGGSVESSMDYALEWSGENVQAIGGESFVLAPAVGPASSLVQLMITDAIGCTNVVEANFSIRPRPEVFVQDLLEACDQSISIPLPEAIPTGGFWEVPFAAEEIGSEGESFMPSGFGTGSWSMVYTFEDEFGCNASDTTALEITAPVVLSLASEVEACADVPVFQLPEVSEITGTWSGPGLLDVVGGSVDLTSLEVGQFQYLYSAGEASCLVTDSLNLVIHALPEITSSVVGLACPGDSVQILTQVNGNNTGIDFTWYAEDASTLTVAGSDADVIWDMPGTYAVELTAADTNGCSAQSVWDVLIPELPEVFAGSDLLLCNQSFSVSLNEANPVSNGQGSGLFYGLEAAEEAVQLEGVLDPMTLGLGTFEVEYVYLDSLTGCSASDTLQVVVEPVPEIFAGLDTAFCAGVDLVELGASSSELPAIWNGVGTSEQTALVNAIDGIIDLSLLSPGSYLFQYEGGQNSCFVSDERAVIVHDLPVIALELESMLCAGDLSYALPSPSPAGGSWSGFGVLDSIAGSFDVNLAANDYAVQYSVQDDSTGCGNFAAHTVRLHSIPVAEFPIIPQQCIGQGVTVLSSSTAVESYTWFYGDTLVSNSVDATVVSGEEGSLNLSLTVVNEWGCIDSVQQDVHWIAPPEAAFSLTQHSGCVPFNTGIESAVIGQVDLVQWSIDGAALVLESGDSILLEVPSSASGNILQMLVSNACGVDSMQDTLFVADVPSIQILETTDGGCSPFFAEFTFESDGQLDALMWSFGNGEETNGFAPVWPVFEAESEPIEYFAFLTASNNCGSVSDSVSVLVEPALAQAQFDLDVTSGCLPLSITATDYSAGGDMVHFEFGDGTMVSDSVSAHTYTAPGTYVVTQIVSGTCSVDTVEMNVTVHPAFELDFAPTNADACLGDSVWFDVTPSAPSSSIEIEWSTPLGAEILSVPAYVGMSSSGPQILSATATDSLHGCSAQSTFEVFVHSPLVIAIDSNIQSGCSPVMIALENQTEGGGQWSWSIDDEVPFSNAFSPELSLTNDGVVPLEQWIQVEVVSEWGCSSHDSVHVEVLPSPTGTFQLLDSVACGVPALMTTHFEAEESWQLAWFIDTVLVSAEDNVELEFSSVGHHVITLMSENEFGCHGLAQDSVEILDLPQVSLAAGPLMGCAPHLLEVEHASTGAVDWLLEIHLDSMLVFESDSETSEVMLDVPGSYGVSYTAVSDRGCVASIALEDSVVVLPRPSVGFYADPYAGTFDAPDPLNSSWVFENVSDAGQAIWDFGDGDLSSEWHGTHAYDASGTFEVLLTVINDFGCASEFMMIVEVLESLEVYVPNAFTPPEQGYADGINDGWKPILSDPSLVDRYELMVYNRYGQLVWESQDPSAHWVGEAKVGGSYFAPGGIYTWVLQIDSKAFSESSRQWKGQVNLLR